MNLGSEVTGTTTGNGRVLSRCGRKGLTRRVWFFNTITVSHCAQFTRLHGVENLQQKILGDSIIHWSILAIGVPFLRADSYPYWAPYHPLIIVSMIWSDSRYQPLHLMVDSSACHHLFLNCKYRIQHVMISSWACQWLFLSIPLSVLSHGGSVSIMSPSVP